MSTKASKAKAEAVLAAVKAQYASYFEPLLHEDGSTLSEGWPEPVLIDRGDRFEVVWEEGPDEWVFTLDGGSGEEDRVLAAQAAQEFGANVATTVKAVERPPAKMPPGVYVEPVNHITLAVYPA